MLFGKHILSALIFLVGVSIVSVSVLADNNYDLRWLKKSEQILKNAENATVPEWLKKPDNQEHTEDMKQLSRQAADIALQEVSQNTDAKVIQPSSRDNYTLIFISLGIPEDELKSLLSAASGQDVMLVVRGLRKDDSIDDMIKEFHKLAEGLEPKPNISLNPNLFKDWHVEVVPTIIKVKGEVNYEGRGVYDPLWFDDYIKSYHGNDNPDDKHVDLGKFGNTYEILEPDFVDLLKQRLANYDWESRKKDAIDNYWKKYSFINLPTTQKDKQFYIDPTIEVTEDVYTPDQQLIAAKGAKYNPLDYIAFSKTLIIFDGTSNQQLEFIEKNLDNWAHPNKSFVLITTALDQKDGWKSLNQLEKRFYSPVYILNRELLNRFNIQHVPSIVTAEGKALKVMEVKPSL